jgi:hypothetical protein
MKTRRTNNIIFANRLNTVPVIIQLKQIEKMTDFQQFLYVLVKEIYVGSKKQKIDTVLHIVYWKANEELEYDDHFVIYGQRPNSKVTGEFIPYRLKCQTPKQVKQFVQTVVSRYHNLSIELHQFYGNSDDSEDLYNIDWENTADDSRTELVAYDIIPELGINGVSHLKFEAALSDVLNVIMNQEVV